ncbi:hypothetical protein D0Y65_011915 [Glycine soja]|uniref:Uncharacterized protein n=1 Tax=Glycine soja TaxID=3848 RepID=A0A445KLY4_GLYSO|nr:hypothetical protein D0Y65_011915 [Glycine soja]
MSNHNHQQQPSTAAPAPQESPTKDKDLDTRSACPPPGGAAQFVQPPLTPTEEIGCLEKWYVILFLLTRSVSINLKNRSSKIKRCSI